MHIPVTCTCGAKLKAPAEAAGRNLKCPKCSAVLAVPAAAADAPVDLGAGLPAAGLPPQQAPPQAAAPPQPGQYPPQGYPPQQQYPPQGATPQGYPPQQQYPPQGAPPQGYPQQAPPPGYGYQQQAQPKPKPKKQTSMARLGIIIGIVTALAFGTYFGTMTYLKGKEQAKIDKETKANRARFLNSAELREANKSVANRKEADAKMAPATEEKNEYDTGSKDIFKDVKGSDKDLELADLIEQVMPSIVRLNVEGAAGAGTGSGYFLDTEGKIATNFHVVEGAINITAETADGKKTKVLGFISVDVQRDLAIVQIDPSKLDCIPLPITKSMPRAGDKVAAFGAPQNLSFTTTNGIVSRIYTGAQLNSDLRDTYVGMGYTKDMKWLQTSAAISGGNSGGPLVNMKGEMVGMNTWKHARGENLNFSSAMTEIQKAFKKRGDTIKSWRKLPRGRRSR